MLSLKDLFNISNHNWCCPLKSSLISLVLNFEVIYSLEFRGKKAVTYVSIFMLVAGSIVMFLAEWSRKTFLCRCFGFLTVPMSFSNKILWSIIFNLIVVLMISVWGILASIFSFIKKNAPNWNKLHRQHCRFFTI